MAKWTTGQDAEFGTGTDHRYPERGLAGAKAALRQSTAKKKFETRIVPSLGASAGSRACPVSKSVR